MDSTHRTGYGPRSRLCFDGNEDKYELWEIKFFAHLRLQKLSRVFEDAEVNASKNADVFAELVQVLDDKSLSLVIRDAKDDGINAMKILREYYLGSSKPRIIALYTGLTSLKMCKSENVTDYMLRAESCATSLTSAGEKVSDGLLVAMVLKGLPEDYKAFSTVITQREKTVTFSEFKIALRNYEENEKCRSSHLQSASGKDDNVMNFKSNVNSA